MKNKKLFAILTLVCFLMTLMPVAAFANIAPANSELVIADEVNVKEPTDVQVLLKDTTGTIAEHKAKVLSIEAEKDDKEASDLIKTNIKTGLSNGDWLTNNDTFSAVFLEHGTYEVTMKYTTRALIKDAEAKGEMLRSTEWRDEAIQAGKAAGVIASTQGPDGNAQPAPDFELEDVQKYINNYVNDKFDKFVPAEINRTAQTITSNSVKVLPQSDFETRYRAHVEADGRDLGWATDEGRTLISATVAANETQKTAIDIHLIDREAQPVIGKELKLSAPGLILSDKTVTTDKNGDVHFTVSAAYAQEHQKIYVETKDKFNFVIPVDVIGINGAVDIEGSDKIGPTDILGERIDDSEIEFTMYDNHGNEIVPVEGAAEYQNWIKASKSADVDAYANFVKVVEQPANSNIKNEDLYFDGEKVCSAAKDGTNRFKKEGTYVFEVVLDNGTTAARTTVEVKEMGNPVKVVVEYPEAVERGAFISAPTSLKLIDNSGVEKDVTPILNSLDLSASGDAVQSFTASTGALKVKSDEKYVGSTIKIQAYWHNKLVGETSIKVAGEATRLNFDTNKANVNEPTKIGVNIVDEFGNDVTLGHSVYNQGNLLKALVNINYTVLNKPEGAKVTLSTDKEDTILRNLTKDGSFDMNFTCDKVGRVTVQATVKYSAIDLQGKTVTKYYTGTQVVNVGVPATGDVVVMSIGSHQIIINDKTATIDSEPVIKDNRTFVPFRALAEAFGAKVDYNEANRTVTSELNGVTVVMTIGSNEYTINGETKTMDVAPYIDGNNRTMVPVRFAAEAFGIEVIPTYNPDGTTADVLFLL